MEQLRPRMLILSDKQSKTKRFSVYTFCTSGKPDDVMCLLFKVNRLFDYQNSCWYIFLVNGEMSETFKLFS